MAKTVMFYPNDRACKYPTGALKVGERLKLHLEFTRPQNVAEVRLVLKKDGEDSVDYVMEHATTLDDGTLVYEVELPIGSAGLYFYHFIIASDDEDVRVGADIDQTAMYGKGADWQLTVYEQNYADPEWLNGGIMYQILPDRFFIGGERNETKPYAEYRSDWGGLPEYRPSANGEVLNEDFFGGNIKGITKKLAYLKSLGVTCIYINPVFEARSNHKYDTGNYMNIDPDFGTEDDLKDLIKKAAKKGMRVMLDGVFSHTGADSIYFNKYGTYDSVGAWQSVDSPYRDWYKFKEGGYDCWWNIDTLPEVNEDNPRYKEFITGEAGVLRKWTRLGLGGWRLDVADELTDGFLESAAKAIKSVNPEAVLLGEVWEDASNKIAYGARRKYLLGRQLDSVTNYPFKEDIVNYIKTGDSRRLNNTINFVINNYPKRTLDNLMNMLGTHDTARILTELGDNGTVDTPEARAKAKVLNLPEAIAKLKMAATVQYTLPGVPCVYYGDEVGLEGFSDPFNRRCFPWDNKNKDILRHYKKLGALRTAERKIFATGTYKPLKAEGGIFAFARVCECGEEVITIVNNTDNPYKPELVGDYTDLITMKPFNGTLKPRTAVVVKLTETVVFPEK